MSMIIRGTCRIDFPCHTCSFACARVGFTKCPKKCFGVRVISHAITNRDVSCARVSLAYCRCSWKKKEGKENPSCTITLASLARPISFSRRACNSFRQFFCRHIPTRENSGCRNYRAAAAAAAGPVIESRLMQTRQICRRQ